MLAFHCNEGHEIKQFECPNRNCKATIQVQKRIDNKVSKATIIGNAFYSAPAEFNPWWKRLWSGLHNRRVTGLTLPLGFDRRQHQNGLWRLLNWLMRRDIRRRVMVPENVYGRHMSIFGKSGMGKSKFILGMAHWMFENDMGATFVDKAGDLANEIIRIVPEHRKDDVLWIRVADSDCPFQLNILETNDVDEEIDLNEDLLHSLKQMSHSWGEAIARDIEIGIETARSVGGSLKTVYDLFTNSRTRTKVLGQLSDQELIEFWDDYDRQSLRPGSRNKTPAARKLGTLVKHKRLGPMLGAAKSNFDADEIVRGRKIVVLDLSTGSAAQRVNIVLGTFIIGKIRAAAFRQQFVKEEDRVRHFLVVDEAKNFMHRGMDFEKIFSEARKFKLSLVLANQNVGQMNDDVKTEAFGNAGVLVAFNVDNTDAKLFADRMQNVSMDEITMQGVGECVVKMHNTTQHVKTVLPTVPDYDPTQYIAERMKAMNTPEVDETDEAEPESTEGSPAYFAEVCEGVT